MRNAKNGVCSDAVVDRSWVARLPSSEKKPARTRASFSVERLDVVYDPFSPRAPLSNARREPSHTSPYAHLTDASPGRLSRLKRDPSYETHTTHRGSAPTPRPARVKRARGSLHERTTKCAHFGQCS